MELSQRSTSMRDQPGAATEEQYREKEQKASALSYVELCHRLNKLSRGIRERARRLDVLFPVDLRKSLKGCSPYPLFRLLVPELDNQRAKYNVKQLMLARMFVDALGLDAKRSTDAQKLLRVRVAGTPGGGSDFPEVLQEVLEGRVNTTRSLLTLGEVNELLDELSLARDNDERKSFFEKILQIMSPSEQKWLVRIILRDLKIGLKEDAILGFFHPQAVDMYNSTCDLRHVCYKLSDRRLMDRESARIRCGRPFTPMLAAALRHQLYKVEPAMKGAPFAIETKFDGERMLCHKRDKEVLFFTRSATDYTEKYGPILTPRINESVNVETCILDGEVVSYDQDADVVLPFKENRTIAAEGESTRTLIYVVFDVLYLEGHGVQALLENHGASVDPSQLQEGPLTHLPLRVRRDLLEAILTPQHRKLELASHHRVEITDVKQRTEEVMDAFDHALENLEEGLIIKSLNSPYLLGEKSRATQHWVKLKPEYSDMTTNLDLLILGAYYSEGKAKAGTIASFLLGVSADPEPGGGPGATQGAGAEDDDDDDVLGSVVSAWANAAPPAPKRRKTEGTQLQYYTVGRVGSGFTLADIKELTEKIPFKEWKPGMKLPSHFKPWKASRADVPDFWVEPDKSVILETKCADIIDATSFSAGLSLRFPRAEAVRYDKPWHQAMTLHELKSLADDPARKPTLEHFEKNGQRPKRPSAARVPRQAPHRVVSSFVTLDPTKVQAERDVLEDMEFCVVGDFAVASDSSESESASDGGGGASDSSNVSLISKTSREDHRRVTKAEIEKLILQNGGDVTASPTVGSTFMVVTANDRSLRVKILIKAGHFDIVRVSFILRCIRHQQLLPASFYDYIYMTKATRERMSKTMDKYGDSYTDPLTKVELRRCFRAIEDRPPLRWRELAKKHLRTEEEQAVISGVGINIFWSPHVCFYVDCFSNLGPEKPLSRSAIPPRRGLPSSRAPDRPKRLPLPFTTLDHVSYTLQLLGGDVSDSLHSRVTHVIVDPEANKERFLAIRERLKLLRRKAGSRYERRVVRPEWVEACLAAGRIIEPETHFIVSDLGEHAKKQKRLRGRSA